MLSSNLEKVIHYTYISRDDPLTIEEANEYLKSVIEDASDKDPEYGIAVSKLIDQSLSDVTSVIYRITKSYDDSEDPFEREKIKAAIKLRVSD